LEFTDDQLTDELKRKLIGCKKSKHGYSALINAADSENINMKMSDADLESIMVHLEKE
jgi:ABC-2 type transport system ATP-binding protein